MLQVNDNSSPGMRLDEALPILQEYFLNSKEPGLTDHKLVRALRHFCDWRHYDWQVAVFKRELTDKVWDFVYSNGRLNL